jgi:hypothetical protein
MTRLIFRMQTRQKLFLGMSAVLVICVSASLAWAQFNKVRPKPSEADWLALSKLPDFTGVWEQGGGGGNRGNGGARGDGAGRGTRGDAPQADAGARAGGGRRGGGGRAGGPAFTPAYLAKAEPNEDPSAVCLPPGMPNSMNQPYPVEFLMTPGKVTMIIEAFQQVRHIYTDGRPLPEDPEERFQGTSVGHWEGDTLVVETIGFSPLVHLQGGVPHSDKMKIVERMRLTAPDTMSIETTVTDPEALAQPWVSQKTLTRHRTWTISEYVCEENNRNVRDQSGNATTILSNPGGLPKAKE